MLINFNRKICNLEGIQLVMDGTPLTLGVCAISALLGTYDDERINAGEKCLRHAMARRIYEKRWDLTFPEIEKVRTLIGKNFTSLVVGSCFEALDGKYHTEEEAQANGSAAENSQTAETPTQDQKTSEEKAAT